MARKNQPILNIKQKKRKSKKKATYIPISAYRLADPDYTRDLVYVEYGTLSDEQRAKLKRSVCDSILRRKKRSPRFNKYKNRTISEVNYRLYHGKTKICSDCERELGTTFFDLQKDKRHSKTYRRPYCVDCRKKKNREAYLKRKGLLND